MSYDKKLRERALEYWAAGHMVYSPSLESIRALAGTALPIVVLDATDTWAFESPGDIMYCHGIHGVMDMCSMLLRRGKRFAIAAGHPAHPGVLRRTAGFVRAAAAAQALTGSKAGTIGGPFKGMGDFAVTDTEMRERFGVEVVTAQAEALRELIESISEDQVKEEIESDLAAFQPMGEISREVHVRCAGESLALRKWIMQESLSAFTVNFSRIGPETGLATMPFLEACKAMARGTGYAGEGDVLTAAFTGALLRGFEDASFIEIFCPDWKGNRLYLSHMGEMNLRLAAERPELLEKELVLGDPIKLTACGGCFRGGEAIYVNICRRPAGFRLVVSPVTMEAERNDSFRGIIRGWMRPRTDIAAFLEAHSYVGATHHSILVYGAKTEQLRFFGELLNMEVVEI